MLNKRILSPKKRESTLSTKVTVNLTIRGESVSLSLVFRNDVKQKKVKETFRIFFAPFGQGNARIFLLSKNAPTAKK